MNYKERQRINLGIINTKTVYPLVIVLFTLVIYVEVSAQQEMDTILLKGDYQVLCACIFKDIAVIDVESVSDPGLVNRLYYRYNGDNSSETIKAGDKIELNINLPFTGLDYRTRYIIRNKDDLALFVYQPMVYNKTPRALLLRNNEVQYSLSKKCSKSTVTKVNWFTWRFR